VHDPIYLVLAFASVLSAFFPYAVLKGLAEMLRVQKKAAGIPFAGVLSTPLNPITNAYCEKCGALILKENQPTCDKCKEPLDWPPSK
jgi:uncharacterized membrane protein